MSARARTPRKRWFCFYGSYRLRGSDERRRVKRDLRNGREPAPRYATGKQWND